MNKKVLSALLFGALMAGTGTFTSCIDNDEPAGIEELRGAKAELIRAKVAVEQANAAYGLAKAEVEKANAAMQQANAAYRLAETKKMEAQAAAEEAKTEAEKAKYQKEIAQYKLDMEKAAKEHEVLMAGLEKSLAEAQYGYEMALKQIAIAKAILTDDLSKANIAALEKEVEDAYDAIYAEDGLKDQIRDAEETLYNAMLDKAASQDGAGGEINYVPQLKLEVTRAEAGVVAAEEALALINEFLDKDVETTDWRAEIETLNDSIKALELAEEAKNIEIAKATASEEYLAADQKVNGVKKDGVVVENGTKQDLEAAIKLYDDNTTGTSEVKKIEQKLSKREVEVNKALTAIVNKAWNDYKNDLGADDYVPTAYAAGTFALPGTSYDQAKYAEIADKTADNYAPLTYAAEVAAFAAVLEAAAVPANDPAAAELELAGAEKAVEAAEKVYNDKVALWQVALNAKLGVATAVPTDSINEDAAFDANIEGAVAAYNTALETLAAKVAAYNTAFEAAVESEFAKLQNKEFETKYLADMYSQLTTAPLSYTGVPTSGPLYTIADLEKFYGSKTGLTEAQIKAEKDMMAATKKAATIHAAQEAIAQEEAWTTSAIATAATVKAVKDANDAIFNADPKKGAQAAANAAYGKLSTIWAAYEGLANSIYAQKLTADKTKVNFEVATGVGAKVKIAGADYTVVAGDWAKLDSKTNAYVVVRTAVSEENYGKLVATKLDETLADNAWKSTSAAAFGTQLGDRAIAPSETEVREDGGDLATQYGAFGAYLAAQDALTDVEDRIAAADKLEALAEEFAAVKKAVEDEIAANEAKFAELLAAIEAADKANEEAKAELAEIKVELVGELTVELAKITAKKGAVEGVAQQLAKSASAILGNGYSYEDAEKFAEDLAAAAKKAEDDVILAEKAVLLAKKNLQLAEEGKYDAVADAQYELDKLNAELEIKMAELEEAIANLDKALEILAAE